MEETMSNQIIAGERTQLAKWWRTPSAQAAMQRAKEKKREQIEAMKKRIADKRAELDREIWKEVA